MNLLSPLRYQARPADKPVTFLPSEFAGLAIIGMVLTLFPSHEVKAWGSGHNDVMREVIERLPADLRGTFTPEMVQEAIQHQSHYPDNFDPFLPEDVGDATVTRLVAAGITKRYDLHSERGMAMAFLMLVDALKQEDAAHTALWIAAYSHVVADMAACNHDPLVHTATYQWADWKLKLPSSENDYSKLSPLLDLAGTAHDPEGGEVAFEEAIARLSLIDQGEKPEELLLEIMLYGQTGADFCAPRGVRVLEGAVGWIDRQDPSAREMLWRNLGELGAWAVVRTLRDVAIARRYAKSDQNMDLTPELEAIHRENVTRFLAGRRIEDDALFAPLLREIDSTKGPVTGIVFEPCWAMNGAMLGFAARVPSAAIARHWQRTGKPYTALDLRRALDDGFPAPEIMPQLVIVAASFHSYQSLKSDALDHHLQAYLDAGGRVVWVSGTTQPPQGSFANFRSAMHQENTKSKLPVSDEDFLGARIQLIGIDLSTATIAHPAATKAGWHQPFCPWTFRLDTRTDLRPLITLETANSSHLVGVVDSAGKRALLPLYAVTPYLFATEDRPHSPHEPSLNLIGGGLLEGALKALALSQ